MNSRTEHILHRFVRGFSERWMRMDHIDDVFHSSFQRNCSHGFCDHLGHSSTRATGIYAKVDLRHLREVAAFDLGALS